MKRILVFALSLALAFSLSACTPTQEDPPEDTSTPEVTEPADTSEPEQTATAEPDDQEPQETVETTDDTEPVEPTTTEIPDLFTSVNETVYATSTVNIREGFSADTDKVGSLGKGQSVKRVGIGTGDAEGWSQVEFNGQTAYISSDYLSLTKPAAQSSGSNSGSQTSQGSSGGQQSSGSQSSSGGQTQTQQPSTSGGNSYRDTAIPPEMQSQPSNWMEEGTGGSAAGYEWNGEFHDKQEMWEGIQ
ncbi:SH3 domain-containing protein [Intestinimonas butyriciproducens]|uniref:SH3 domain-containing protein n=1 Tax=Intestinimonas butyriciproducens TaxID=1297617 RepID=UPI00195E83C4|nr:SH3 domain-containing protein [Intestinimonas butyriciproducens]MBM6977554.1 SH3 domain-containing protein [Intestinimonas butyriciproducens]